MTVEELREMSLEDLTDLANIVGVSSIEELFDLLVTTASKSAEKISDAPGVVSVITAREIEQFGARTLKEVLNHITGVGILNNYFNRNGLAIRGDQQASPYSNHVLLLMDGRPMRENMYVGNDMGAYGMFPVSGIERIEVIRGPGSVLYGTSAYSGIINIIMKKAAKESSLTLSGQAGSFGTTLASLDGGFTAGDFRLYGSVNYLNQTSWTQKLTTEDRQRDTTFNSRQRGVSTSLSMQYKGLTANVVFLQYGADVLGTLPDFPTVFYDRTNLYSDLGYTHEFSDVWKSSINLTYSQYNGQHDFTDISRDFVAEFTNYIKPVKNLNIVLGGLINTRSGQMSVDVPGVGTIPLVAAYNQLWGSVYTQIDYTPFEQLKLIAGVQANKIERIPVNVVPRAGVILTITPELGVKALYGQAFRGPSAFETSINVPGVLLGNPDVTPELIGTFDAELFYKKENVQLSLVYFNSNQSNLMIQGLRSGLEPKYRNEGTFRSQGVEFEGKYAPTEQLYILGSASYQTNVLNEKFENSTPIPNLIARLGGGYNNRDIGLSVGVFNIFYSQPNDVAVINPSRRLVNPTAQAFNLLNVNINWNLTELFNWVNTPGFILNFRVDNALDAQAWQPEWLRREINTLPLLPGRGIYGGLTIKF